MNDKLTVAVIGVGNMGRAIVRGLSTYQESIDFILIDPDNKRLGDFVDSEQKKRQAKSEKERHDPTPSGQDRRKAVRLRATSTAIPKRHGKDERRHNRSHTYQAPSTDIGEFARVEIYRPDVVFLAVKPQTLKEAMETETNFGHSEYSKSHNLHFLLGYLAVHSEQRPTLISLAAGIELKPLRDFIDHITPKQHKQKVQRTHPDKKDVWMYTLARFMPNLMVAQCRGVGGYVLEKRDEHAHPATEPSLSQALKLLSHLGNFLPVREDQMHAITALAGSGPAYVSIFAQALADAAVDMGLPREMASELVPELLAGSAHTLKSQHPIELSDAISSPGGTTIAGLKALKSNHFEYAIWEAIDHAARRSVEISKRFSRKSSE